MGTLGWVGTVNGEWKRTSKARLTAVGNWSSVPSGPSKNLCEIQLRTEKAGIYLMVAAPHNHLPKLGGFSVYLPTVPVLG